MNHDDHDARDIIHEITDLVNFEITDPPTKKAVLERTGIGAQIRADFDLDGRSLHASHGNDCSYLVLVDEGELSVFSMHWSTHGTKEERKLQADSLREMLARTVGTPPDQPLTTVTQHNKN